MFRSICSLVVLYRIVNNNVIYSYNSLFSFFIYTRGELNENLKSSFKLEIMSANCEIMDA